MLTLPSYKLACTWLSVAAHRSLKYAPIDELGGGGSGVRCWCRGAASPPAWGSVLCASSLQHLVQPSSSLY